MSSHEEYETNMARIVGHWDQQAHRRRMIPTWAKGQHHGIPRSQVEALSQHCPTCEVGEGEPCSNLDASGYQEVVVHEARWQLVMKAMARESHEREVALLVEFLRDHVDILSTPAVPVQRLMVR